MLEKSVKVTNLTTGDTHSEPLENTEAIPGTLSSTFHDLLVSGKRHHEPSKRHNQVGNAVPPLLAYKIAKIVSEYMVAILERKPAA